MRTTLTAIALTITVLAGAGSAHVGEIVYPIYEIPTSDLPDLHDGTLDDWEAVLPNASLSQNDFIRNNSGIPGTIDMSDLAFRVFLAWHNASQRIYVAVELFDDVYTGEGFQLRIDGDHSGGQYWFFEDEGYSRAEVERFWESQAQTYSAWPEEDGEDGARLTAGGPERMWMVDDPWAGAGAYQIGENPSYSGVEVAVTAWDDLDWHGPEVSRRSILEAGGIIGFQVVISDSDEPMRSNGTYTLGLSTDYYRSENGGWAHDGFAENFVDGELIPCYRGDCSGNTTAVKPDAWGRIKASFR